MINSRHLGWGLHTSYVSYSKGFCWLWLYDLFKRVLLTMDIWRIGQLHKGSDKPRSQPADRNEVRVAGVMPGNLMGSPTYMNLSLHKTTSQKMFEPWKRLENGWPKALPPFVLWKESHHQPETKTSDKLWEALFILIGKVMMAWLLEQLTSNPLATNGSFFRELKWWFDGATFFFPFNWQNRRICSSYLYWDVHGT